MFFKAVKGKTVKIRCSPATVMGYESHNISHCSEYKGWEGVATRSDALSQETNRISILDF
jgi:hypothetical protein